MSRPTPDQRQAAHALLDRAKAGERVPVWEIMRALVVTGDVTPGDDPQHLISPAGSWGLSTPAASAMRPASWIDPII